MVAARVGNLRTVAAGRSRARIEPAAQDRWIKVSSDVSESGTLWDRVGSPGRSNVVLRHGAAVFAFAQTMARSAYRVPSTCAGQAGMDDQRDYQGAIARFTGGPPERCGQSA